ncbi:MAG: hypothetical protein IJ916_05380 [Paludibacteraceae bacterium]|nr:hypothetical protein [Paludibacteraceae bacterium]MBR2261115.1 hypothetical protein [Paludibacteraceae bacterium]MEE3483779.1 hypothetical protein [Bacteroidales bacterium]
MDNNTQQEMNIFQVMERIGQSIKKFFCLILSSLGRVAQLAYKYKYLFLVFVALIVALCVYQRRDNAKMYRAQMHILINDGDLFTYDNMLKQLSEYPKRHDVEGLAEEMNISAELASKIYSFQCYHVIDINHDSIMDYVDYKNDIKLGDTSNVIVPNRAVICAKLNDPNYCEDIQKSLIAYFSNNPYLASLNIARLSSLEEREWMFHNALLNLDSLQKIELTKGPSYSMEFASQKDRDKPFLTTKRQPYYQEMKTLFDINENIAVDMSCNLEVATVVSNMQLEYKLDNPTWKIILYTTLLGLILFTIIAGIWEHKKDIVKYLENKEK